MLRSYYYSVFPVIALLCSSLAAQTVLIDRAPDPNLLGGGIIGGVFSDRPGDEVSALTVVTFGGDVQIGSVTVFTTNLNSAIADVGYPVGGTSPAILNIFDGDTLELGDNTLTGGDFGTATATAQYTEVTTGIEITVADQNISLAAGTYLIGVTPVLDFGENGQEFFLDAGAAGQDTFLNNPGGQLFGNLFPEIVNANELDLPTTYSGMSILITAVTDILLGDLNLDGTVDLLDVAPFVDAILNGTFIPEGDFNGDGVVDLLDVQPFVQLILG